MPRVREICERVAPVVFYCSGVLWVVILVIGTDTPQHTWVFFLGIVIAFGLCAIVAALGRRFILAMLSGIIAVMGVPMTIWIGYLFEMFTAWSD